jgi:hypothetical protein
MIKTFRTGRIPGLYPGDKINLNERDKEKKDHFICQGKIIAVFPIQFRDIGMKGRQEIRECCNRRIFNYQHWFFQIIIRKDSISYNKQFDFEKLITDY